MTVNYLEIPQDFDSLLKSLLQQLVACWRSV